MMWAILIVIAILVIGLGIWYGKKYGLQLYYWFSDDGSKLPPKRHFRVRELGETEDEENAIPIARVPTEYVTKYSDRLAAETQRIIDELHWKIGEASERAMARLERSMPSNLSEETLPPSKRNRNFQKTVKSSE